MASKSKKESGLLKIRAHVGKGDFNSAKNMLFDKDIDWQDQVSEGFYAVAYDTYESSHSLLTSF